MNINGWFIAVSNTCVSDINTAAAVSLPIFFIKSVYCIVSSDKEYIGSVVGHLCSKRGKVLSIENKGNQQVIAAEAPLADMFGYVSTLRSLTSGRASYSMHFDKYIAVPFALVERIIEEKKEADKESKG